MSRLVVHLDPCELQRRQRERAHAERRQRAAATSEQRIAAARRELFGRINRMQVKEIELLAQTAVAEREVEVARSEAQRERIRARATRSLVPDPATMPRRPLSVPSPRRAQHSEFAVADHSGRVEPRGPLPPHGTPAVPAAAAQAGPLCERAHPSASARPPDMIAATAVEATREASVMRRQQTESRAQPQHGVRAGVPPYLQRRVAEQEQARVLAEVAARARAAAQQTPPGREPLDEDAVRRTREFMRRHIADLEVQMARVPLSLRQTPAGRLRLAQLEEQLRVADDTLRRFAFPVVFVERHRPQLVAGGSLRPIASHMKPRVARRDVL